MIADNIENYETYCKSGSLLEKGFKFLTEKFSVDMEDGKYEIDGEKCFALVQSYDTVSSDEKRWEAHLEYLDIQYVEEGEEFIEYLPTVDLDEEENLTPDSDLIFFKKKDCTAKFVMKHGDFAIFYPQDGHKPGVTYNNVSKIKKVVVKVAL